MLNKVERLMVVNFDSNVTFVTDALAQKHSTKRAFGNRTYNFIFANLHIRYKDKDLYHTL